MVELTVVICTRNRPAQLSRTLDALERQTRKPFSTIVVDQSDGVDVSLDARENVRVLRDSGIGTSRARNAGARAASTTWMIALDDDCVPEPGWMQALHHAVERHPDVGLIWYRVDEGPLHVQRTRHSLAHALSLVTRERLVSGRWVPPTGMGLGCCAVRLEWVRRIGGWDEQLGSGVPDFPGSEDIDFNWRLLRAGVLALLTPAPVVMHEQWRSDETLIALFDERAAAWAGMCVKHVKLGDPLAGAWLYAFGLVDAAAMSLSPLRRRSRLRLAYAVAKWRGLARGTWLAMRRSWV